MQTEWTQYLALMAQRPEAFLPDPRLPIVTDEATVRDFCARSGQRIGVLYQSPYHLLVVDLVQNESGALHTYERLLPTVADSAVVAVVLCQNRFVLLRQFRHALRQSQLCFVRGFGEPGLTPAQNVCKELQEEIGAVPLAPPEPLGVIAPDSGIQAAQAHVFCCTVAAFDPHPHTESIVQAVALTPQQLQQQIAAGAVTDGFTLAAHALYTARLRERGEA